MARVLDLGYEPLKNQLKIRMSSFVPPSQIFVWGVKLVTTSLRQLYAPQTKILEGRTNISERVFEALFKGVSTQFGLRIVEKCFENAF